MVSTGRWLRRHSLPFAAAVGVLAAAIVAGILVLSVADREDSLREAEVEYAELEPLSVGLTRRPADLVSRRSFVVRRDLSANQVLSRKATAAASRAAAVWSDRRSALILRRTHRLARLSNRTVRLGAAGRHAAALALLPRLRELQLRQIADVGATRRLLKGRADRQAAEATGLMLLIMGTAGIVLVAFVFAIFAARRRRISDELEQEAQRRSERRLDALLSQGSDMITVVAPDTTVLYQAGPVRALLGYEPIELEGIRLSEVVEPEGVSELLALCAAADEGSPARELRFRHRDGTARPCEVRAMSLLGDASWNGVVLNIWDVSQRKALEDELLHQAFHDTLTDLPNRAHFADRLERALADGARAECAVAVFLVDLDDFKAINDSFGHSVGDALLQRVSRALLNSLPEADTVARLGGDEFAVIIEGSGSSYADEATARRILTAVEKPFEIHGRSYPVAASVGIARAEAGDLSADQLMRNADLAMYAVKGNRKSGWALYHDEMCVSVEERLQLKADLAQAAPKFEGFELYYQPVVDVARSSTVGFEALLRWNHSTRGMLGPDRFIRLAEESGDIVPLGRWVLRQACRQLRDWRDRYGLRLGVSVNVSARQLIVPGFARDVLLALREFRLRGDQLVLELTETAMVGNQREVGSVFRQLKKNGVRIAIDDFGTGYSSLSQLQTLPLDFLKVDRDIARSQDRATRRKLMGAVTEIAEALGLYTVAEGIETPEQRADLEALRIPFAQGFLFGPPLPLGDVEDLLARGEVLEPREPPLPNDHEGLTNSRPVIQPPAS